MPPSDRAEPTRFDPGDAVIPPPAVIAQLPRGGVLDVGPGKAVVLADTPVAVRSLDVRPGASHAAPHHVVRSGESLFGIARARLGDGRRWQEIAAVNPGLTPANVRAGQRVRLPS